MNGERWSRIERLYHSAKEQEPGKREQFLTELCGDDTELRRDLESLLRYDTDTAGVLAEPALELAAKSLAAERRGGMLQRTIGHYRIESWIGAGGMGEVYRAIDTRLDRAVAVKMLSRHLSGDADALAWFEREAKAVAALSHPNILAIHDFGYDEGTAYAVTELLQGETLRARLGRGPLDWRQAVEIAGGVADGLASAHAKNITHRDLKPENIFLDENGRVKVLDFGLAQIGPRLADEHPEKTGDSAVAGTRAVLGTVSYMSPEQAEGKKVDPRSDVFSFGSVMYEMLTGDRAFRGETKMAALAAIIEAEPPSMNELAGTVPIRLQQIILRCLSKDPKARFQSAAALLQELKSLGGAASPSRRSLVLAGGILAIVAALTAIAALVFPGWRRLIPGSGLPMRSLAVLPLTNLSGDVEQEYFADGITGVLIADLAQISALRVISHTSAMQFKGSKQALPEIARRLDVDAVIDGTVLRSGDRVRVTAELVDAATDRHLWTRTYERKVGDVLTLQGEVAGAIAAEVRASLTPQEFARLSRSHPIAPATLEAYLKGRYYWGEFTQESLLKSVEYYEQAAKLDPSYASAYAGLAEAWVGLAWMEAVPWEEVDPKARRAAMKALELDDSLGEAHTALGALSLREWNWKKAEEEDLKAIHLNPGYATAHMAYANLLRYQGRASESIAEAKRGVELDPLAMLTNEVLADAYVSARRYDPAIKQCRKALELNPNESALQYALGWAYVYNGEYEKGLKALETSLSLDGVPLELSPDVAYVDALLGKKEEARKILERLLNLAKTAPVNPGLVALIYVGLGEHQEALTSLEEAYLRHSPIMTWLKVDRRFDAIRQEPRFSELMRRVGLSNE